MVSGSDSGHIAGPADLQRMFGVSDCLIERLVIYEAALKRWQKAVNLVAPSTLPDIWHRHFADSLQLREHLPKDVRRLADLGSGGGFPGLVLAAALAEQGGPHVTLVESDTRKAAFLRDTARAMDISVDILSTRIETDASLRKLVGVDVLTARALAPLRRLFTFVSPFFADSATCVFLKGREADLEVEEARKSWRFDVMCRPSITDPSASILVVRHLRPVSKVEPDEA